ncbi:hypothetical protein KZ483_26275 [Paenibacillus sp. sptzw28]|uniref:hypothetical protein n=1 Tax=Paenibacillus sp. sptzw28 TaxID=715179 RepID=UPI001C6F0E89|nr:hypothetical protein [Paenibacillus sp. sptzw28]QYR21165.1 hypothetical protein KZ483_26275 [Paenibacillus sp. sptzw28]
MMKRKWLAVVTAVIMITASFAANASAAGLPSGDHYTLNIIGVPHNKKAPMDNSGGSKIFVPLYGDAKIWLKEGEFKVLDANGTDEDGAAYQLPNPDPENDGTTEYSVYVRALGKPGGSATFNTCGTDPDTGDTYCSQDKLVVTRTAGTSPWVNGSGYLLYVYADTDNDGEPERYPLFDDRFENYYWDYDNNGLKVAQLRFYQGVSTQVQ